MSTLAVAPQRAADTEGGAWPRSILIVGPLPPPSGGMANQTRQLAALLATEGCRVTVAQVNSPYRPKWIGKVRGARAAFRLVPYLLKLWRSAGDTELLHVMANSGWAWHLFAAPAIWIGHLRGKPVVVNYRGGDAAPFLTRQSRWVVPTLRRASIVIVPSGFLAGVFAQHSVTTHVVPNIVDLERFGPGVRSTAPPHVIVTRNLEDIYDLPTALRAFGRIRQIFPGARLTIAGSGPRHADLSRLASELGIAGDVTFSGRLENERIADLYRSAELLLNPSLVDNMPISLLEAMASGVPIVSTNVGGIPHLVEDGKTALLVPPNDPVAMATAALRVLGDRVLARRLTTAGLEAAQAYSWIRVRGRLSAIYAAVLGARLPAESTS